MELQFAQVPVNIAPALYYNHIHTNTKQNVDMRFLLFLKRINGKAAKNK